MKILKKILIIQLLLISTISCAQNQKMETEVDKIKELGKDSIIQLILDRKNEIDITNFEFITVSANHENVYVKFRNSVKYIPLNREIITDLTVPILGSVPATSLNIIRNPSSFRSKEGRKYYNPNDKENKKVIKFVFDAINKNQEIGNTCSEDFEEANVIIKEKETYYDVSVITGSIMSGKRSEYKVKKEAGEIYDVTHSYPSKIPLPLENGQEETYDLTYYFKEQINAENYINAKILKKTFTKLRNDILKNNEPVIDNELEKTTATCISNNIHFTYVKDKKSYLETITIFDTKLAITYNLFWYNRGEINEYSIGSKYSIYLESKMFNEQKYKGIVNHFSKNIVKKEF